MRRSPMPSRRRPTNTRSDAGPALEPGMLRVWMGGAHLTDDEEQRARERIRDIRPRRRPGSAAGSLEEALAPGLPPQHLDPQLHTLEHANFLAAKHPDRLVVLRYNLPSPAQLAELAESWDLHPLLADDLQRAWHQPIIEEYDDVLYLVAQAAAYSDDNETVVVASFQIVMRENQIAIICHDVPQIERHHLQNLWDQLAFDEATPDHGRLAVIHAILRGIVTGYQPVLYGVDVDRQQIELQVFSGDTAVAERIYRLGHEVVDLFNAATGLQLALEQMLDEEEIAQPGSEFERYIEDVEHQLVRVVSRAQQLREALNQILSVNATLVSERQNEDMKKISGWAAILFAPTLIGAIYGMNFEIMPELSWPFGYPMALLAMLGLSVLLWVLFKRKDWM